MNYDEKSQELNLEDLKNVSGAWCGNEIKFPFPRRPFPISKRTIIQTDYLERLNSRLVNRSRFDVGEISSLDKSQLVGISPVPTPIP